MNESNSLSWEITPLEKKLRNQLLIRLYLFTFSGFFIFTFFNYYFSSDIRHKSGDFFIQFFFVISVAVVVAGVAYLINNFFPYPTRRYLLNNDGIVIGINEKIRFYAWSEFQSFYDYSSRSTRTSILQKERGINGKIYYLRKNNRFFPIYLKVYSEPDNYKDVFDFISLHLPVDNGRNAPNPTW